MDHLSPIGRILQGTRINPDKGYFGATVQTGSSGLLLTAQMFCSPICQPPATIMLLYLQNLRCTSMDASALRARILLCDFYLRASRYLAASPKQFCLYPTPFPEVYICSCSSMIVASHAYSFRFYCFGKCCLQRKVRLDQFSGLRHRSHQDLKRRHPSMAC